MISPESPSGELIGAVYLDPRMVWEFDMEIVEETISVIDMTLDIPATKKPERDILTVVRAACEKRMDCEERE